MGAHRQAFGHPLQTAAAIGPLGNTPNTPLPSWLVYAGGTAST
jgi:hypothetical protein